MTMVTFCRKVLGEPCRFLTTAILAMALFALLDATALEAQTLLSQYVFMSGTGSQITMSAPSTIFGNNFDDGVSGPYNIGFTFTMCGSSYTQFSCSSNGYIGLGSSNASSYLSGTFGSTNPGVPIIAGMWRDLYTASGEVSYQTVGTAPDRILVVQWRVNACCAGGTPGSTFQVRLYEGSNKIELWYGGMNVSCAQIGAQFTTSNYASITAPAGTVSYTSGNSCSGTPSMNALYTFAPCVITVTGNTTQGGTANMADQDSLLRTITLQRGNSATYQPFTVTGPGCGATSLSFTIGGAAAADYQITPASTTVSSSTSVTPAITFNPQGIGVRVATLTVTAPSFTRTYYLAGNATPRILWTGNPAQGGTPAMKDGDTILSSVSILRGTSTTAQPFTLTNTNTNPSASAAQVTYTIKGTSGGQYSIAPPTTTIAPGGAHTPTITFNAQGIGVVVDTLIAVVDGERRTFALRAFSQAPGGEFDLGPDRLDTNSLLFRNRFGCIGEETVTYQIDVVNIGYGAFTINSVDFFQLDTAYRQGIPRYALARNSAGALVRSSDFIVTDKPPVIPTSSPANQSLPITVDAGKTKTIYLTFVAQGRDKRFTRAYFRTNGQNFTSLDTNGAPRLGMFWMDLFPRGTGSRLAGDATGAPFSGWTFPVTRIGDSVDITFPLYNPGECALRVSLRSLIPVSGDVEEFGVVRAPAGLIDPATNDAVIAPGSRDSITIRFKPLQVGSRRASLRLMTNDSTRQVSGIIEKGLYYVDMFGIGKFDLYTNDVDFGTALIGGAGADQQHRVVRVKNTQNGPIVITKVVIDGTDAADFTMDASKPWPAMPATVFGGQELQLGVTFSPVAGGQPGSRAATARIIMASGDTIVSKLTGIAGTRTVAVNQSIINFGTVSSGKLLRKTITIMNTGTMPATLTAPQMSPGSDFTVGQLARLVLAPGQTEYVEVTYAPQTAGGSTATLTFGSDATNGSLQVTLNGTATKTKQVVVDPSQAVTGGRSLELSAADHDGSNELQGLSGVASEDAAGGARLWQSAPNPARDHAEIRYSIPSAADVRLELYDMTGRLVRVLDAGHREAGETRVMIDVRELGTGTYHYRLNVGERALSGTMTVAR